MEPSWLFPGDEEDRDIVVCPWICPDFWDGVFLRLGHGSLKEAKRVHPEWKAFIDRPGFAKRRFGGVWGAHVDEEDPEEL